MSQLFDPLIAAYLKLDLESNSVDLLNPRASSLETRRVGNAIPTTTDEESINSNNTQLTTGENNDESETSNRRDDNFQQASLITNFDAIFPDIESTPTLALSRAANFANRFRDFPQYFRAKLLSYLGEPLVAEDFVNRYVELFFLPKDTEPTIPEPTIPESDAIVFTDKDDYAPGDTAKIFGSNFDLGETIELQVLHIDDTPNTGGGHEPWLITDGGAGDLDGVVDGNFETTWFVNPDDSGDSAFKLTANGLTSGETAIHYFTDSDPAVQFFYVPGEETDLLTAFGSLTANIASDNQAGGNFAVPVSPITSIISLTISTDETIIYYDHWETEGYETDISNPTQSTTEIWGDNNPDNGIAPGFTVDLLNAGDIITLESDVVVPRVESNLFFDGRDKVGASKAIVMTRTAWADASETLLAGAWEVFDTSKFGIKFTIPIGEDVDTDSGGSIDEIFEYVGLVITASEDGTSVDIDADGDPLTTGDITTVSLDEGETHFIDGGIDSGLTLNSGTKPIQAHLITGNVSEASSNVTGISTYFASRWYTLYPDIQWSNNYYSPVGDTSNNPTNVFVYNPSSSAITVNYQYRDGSNELVTTSLPSIAAGAVYRHELESDSGYRFYTTSDNFAILSAVSADNNASDPNGGSNNATYDWGHNLISDSNLNPVIVIGYSPGSDDVVTNGTTTQTPDDIPDEADYSPVWVTPVSDTIVYVNYTGDLTQGSLTDPNGNKYDVDYPLKALQSQKIFDTSDNDMTGARIYTVDNTNLSAAWGQDPDTAERGSPSIDVGTAVLPFPTAYTWKESALITDVDGDGLVDPGDTIEYTINIDNDGVVILGNVKVTDIIPDGTSYVTGSTKVNGLSIGDDGSGTAFPLDDDNIDNGIDSGRNIGNIAVDASATVSFRVQINDPYDGPVEGVTNSAKVDSDEETFTVAINTPIDQSKPKSLYLSDTNDLDRVDPVATSDTSALTSSSLATFTVRDEFNTVGYNNNDGSLNWTSNWDENEQNGNSDSASGGTIQVVNGELRFQQVANTAFVRRNVDLSSFSAATLTYDWRTSALEESIQVFISNQYSAGFVQLASYTGSNSGSASFDISSYISSDTTLLIYNNHGANWTAADDEAFFDNIQIQGTNNTTTTTASFNQSLSMQSSFEMTSGNQITVYAYIDVTEGTVDTDTPANNNIVATLSYDSGSIGTATTPTSITSYDDSAVDPTGNTNAYLVSWNITLDSNVIIPSGEDITLDITNNESTIFNVLYDSSTYPSKIDLPSETVIDITNIGIYDTAGDGNGSLITTANDGDTVYLRVTVTDPFGEEDITSLDLVITDPNGGTTEVSPNDIDTNTNDNTRVFEYAFTPTGNLGDYTFDVTAKEGFEGTVTHIDSTTVRIQDAVVPDVIIGDNTVTESTSLVFDVTLLTTETTTSDLVLDLTASTESGNTATEIGDYETTNFEYSTDGGSTWISAGGTNGTKVTIPAGSSGIKVRIDSISDTTDESDETFTLAVGSVVSGSVGDTTDTGTGTILDDDDQPRIFSIDDVSLVEGNLVNGESFNKEFNFTVTLDNPSSQTITVDYVTANGTATSGSDYTAIPTTTLTFAPGETEKTITVLVAGDDGVEIDDTFFVNLSNPTNATIFDNQGIGTILNDDSTPLFEIDDVSNTEGDSGTQIYTFTVTRSGTTTDEVTIDYATADNTATTADNDYESISGTLTFGAGVTTQTISVTVNGDTPPEGDDTFFVNLSNAVNVTTPANGATITDSQGIGTIVNDDAGGTISGNVQADTNNDNTADTPLSGVTIELLDSDGNSIDSDSSISGVQPTTTTTDNNGDYQFTNVAVGDYQVKETDPSGYTSVSDGDSTDGSDDTPTNTDTNDNFIPVTIAANEIDSGNDFIDEQVGIISGEVLADTNNDDVGDTPLAGVTIELLDGTGGSIDSDPNTTGTQPTTTITDSQGAYSFTNIAPGDYQVQQTNLTNYSDVKDIDTNVDGTANGASGNTDKNLIDVSLSAGENDTGNDFVDERGVISGNVSEDTSDPNDTTGDNPLENVTVELLDSGSNLVATTTTDASGNYSFTNLEPDTYTVRQKDLSGYDSVIDNDTNDDDGAGSVDNDSNTNTNNNELTVALAAGEEDTGNDFVDRAQPGSISGTVLEDTTGNGIGDTPLAGATVTLSGAGSGTFVTGSDGTYIFTGLGAGSYTVTETNPTNYNDVNELDSQDNGADDTDLEDKDTDNNNQLTVVLVANEADTGNDFVDEAQTGTISGTVQADTTGDGSGDTNLQSVTVSLLDSIGNPVLNGSGVAITATTNASGFYEFTDVAPGDYQVVETDLSGYSSVKDEDTDDSDDTNSNTNDNILTVNLSAGETDTNNNFVDRQNGTISGTVEEDTNNSGSGDTALSGVTVTLKDSEGNTVATDVTDINGDYSFSDVTPGDYTVVETDPTGYSSVSDNDNDADATNDDATNSDTNDNILAVTLLPNETDSGNDFVDEQNGSISGSVTADTTGDDAGDTAISGVTITLRNAGDDSTVATTTTDGGGNYTFSDVAPGDYEVVETTPTGYADVNELDSVDDDGGASGADDTDADNETAGADNDNILSITLVGGESDTGNDFVDELSGSISGTVTDNSSPTPNPLAGVTITLKDGTGADIDSDPDTAGVQPTTTTTVANGTYSFTDLPSGDYQVVETDLSTYASVSDGDSVTDSGGEDGETNNGDTNDNIITVALADGETDTGNDFVDQLNVASGTISGQVLLDDTDGDGVGDTPLSGVTITLKDGLGNDIDNDDNLGNGIQPTTTTTASDGTYSFTGLDNGNYQVVETDPTTPSTYVSISDTNGDNDNIIAVNLSGTSTGNDFVDGLPATLSGVVWEDIDGNGIRGPFEDVVEGVDVTLIDGGADGVIGTGDDISTNIVSTNPDGTYTFSDLIPERQYQVTFGTPSSGYTGYTTLDQGSDDTIDSDADPNDSNKTETITLDAGENRQNVDAGLLPTSVITVEGTDGSETLAGGTGDDVIAGYKGQDTLTGGTGSDTFFFNETSDGIDIITDFNSSGADKLDFSKIVEEIEAYNGGADIPDPISSGYIIWENFGSGTMVRADFDGDNTVTSTLDPKDVVFLQDPNDTIVAGDFIL